VRRSGLTGPTSSRRPTSSTILAGGLLYFLVVFAFGFVLGVGRTLWLVPRIEERWAELAETPVMLVVIYLAARWVSGRLSLAAHDTPVQSGVGLVGLALLLGAEIGFILQLRGISMADYVAQRDPVSGTVYALSLALFAAMPALVSKAGERRCAGSL
jgi:hypothetical protein